MAVHFSHQESLGSSLQKTFNGQHPCRLCLKVKKASPSGSSFGSLRGDDSMDALLQRASPSLVKIVSAWPVLPYLFPTSSGEPSSDLPPPKTVLL
jgi:hypothetical protein